MTELPYCTGYVEVTLDSKPGVPRPRCVLVAETFAAAAHQIPCGRGGIIRFAWVIPDHAEHPLKGMWSGRRFESWMEDHAWLTQGAQPSPYPRPS